jgi:hypothetical protein
MAVIGEVRLPLYRMEKEKEDKLKKTLLDLGYLG